MMQVPSHSDAAHLFQNKEKIKKMEQTTLAKVMQRLQQQTT